MIPWHNLGNNVGYYRPVNATVAGSSNINGAGYDLVGSFGGPFDGMQFICSMGTLNATQTTSIKMQGSADNSTWTDIATSQQGPANDGDSNKLLITEAYRIQYRYVRPVVVRGTANAVIDSVVGIAFGAKSFPVNTQDATVSVPTNSHASSTAVPVNIVNPPAIGGTA